MATDNRLPITITNGERKRQLTRSKCGLNSALFFWNTEFITLGRHLVVLIWLQIVSNTVIAQEMEAIAPAEEKLAGLPT